MKILQHVFLYSILLITLTSCREHKKFLEHHSHSKILASIKINENTKEYEIHYDEYDKESPAYISYTLGQEGWDHLSLSSYMGDDNKFTDDEKSYAMGYLEGQVTAEKIWLHYLNIKQSKFFDNNGTMPEDTKLFLTNHFEWIKTTAKEKENEGDEYWHHAYLIYRQLEGLVDGYNAAIGSGKKITMIDFQVMNANGDIGELSYWKKENRPIWNMMTLRQINDYIDENSHCSAIIKLAPDFSDLWFGHNTWLTYSSMIRIFKEYRFKSNSNFEKSRSVTFSGYPGTLGSIDDFYITDRDLYVTETTNPIFITELYDLLTHKSLLTWHRIMIANRLAYDGKSWTEIFSKYNSGTYNNQMQILDLNLVDTENKVVHDNALWVLEQIPGYIESKDVTNILRFGYWPSYNSPYFKSIRERCGIDNMVVNHPELKDVLDYSTCSRANIFRRDQGKVNDKDGFKKLMRYNNYISDPLSKNIPKYTIASRKDLLEDTPICDGATDAKIASIHDIKGQKIKKITIINGPTAEQQTPFNTKKPICAASGKYLFNGMPEVFNYNWEVYETKLFD